MAAALGVVAMGACHTTRLCHLPHPRAAQDVAAMAHISRLFSTLPVFILSTLLLFYAQPTLAIKFELPAYRYPPAKCIWNAAHPGALVIVTANVGPGESQRVDIEIVDAGAEKNVYLSKKAIKGESRFAVTAHSEGDVGVCFRNYLEPGTSCPHPRPCVSIG